MNEERKRIIFMAQCIKPGRSSADYPPVINWELRTIAEGIAREVADVKLSERQQRDLESLMKRIQKLQGVSGADFRTDCVGFSQQVEKFISDLPEASSGTGD